MASLQGKLNAFLDRSARTNFAWGDSDCVLDMADWLDTACDLNCAKTWRGTYSSEAEANAILAPLGGLEAALRAQLDALGLSVTAEPKAGDVALVQVDGMPNPLCAIKMPSGRWRMKTIGGIVLSSQPQVIVAWSLPCRPS